MLYKPIHLPYFPPRYATRPGSTKHNAENDTSLSAHTLDNENMVYKKNTKNIVCLVSFLSWQSMIYSALMLHSNTAVQGSEQLLTSWDFELS